MTATRNPIRLRRSTTGLDGTYRYEIYRRDTDEHLGWVVRHANDWSVSGWNGYAKSRRHSGTGELIAVNWSRREDVVLEVLLYHRLFELADAWLAR